ncbi:MAG: hypothetical protein ABIJ08_02370 [Nanoarchaeota archaeon]
MAKIGRKIRYMLERFPSIDRLIRYDPDSVDNDKRSAMSLRKPLIIAAAGLGAAGVLALYSHLYGGHSVDTTPIHVSQNVGNVIGKKTPKPISTLDQKLDTYLTALSPAELDKYHEYFSVPDKEKIYRLCAAIGTDPHLIFAKIKKESGFDGDAVSKKGARGWIQVTTDGHREVYKFVYSQDEHYVKKREALGGADLIAEMRNIMPLDEKITEKEKEIAELKDKSTKIRRHKGWRRERKEYRDRIIQLNNEIDKLIDGVYDREKDNNGYLLEVGIGYSALAQLTFEQLGREIKLSPERVLNAIISSYNQGIEITEERLRKGLKSTSYPETIAYLKSIKSDYPTFTDIGKQLQTITERGVSLEQIQNHYFNSFLARLHDTRNIDPNLVVDVNIRGNNYRCTLYQITEKGETFWSLRESGVFRLKADFNAFEDVNQSVDVEDLKVGQFIYIPLHQNGQKDAEPDASLPTIKVKESLKSKTMDKARYEQYKQYIKSHGNGHAQIGYKR